MRARVDILLFFLLGGCIIGIGHPAGPPEPDYSGVRIPPGGRLFGFDAALVVVGPDGSYAVHASYGEHLFRGKVDGGLTAVLFHEPLFVVAGSQGVYYVAGKSPKLVVRLNEPIERMIGGDFEPKRAGKEILLVTNEGGVHRLDLPSPDLVAEIGDEVVDAAVFRAPDRDVAMLAAKGGGLCVLRQEGGIYRAHFFHYHDSDLVALSAGPWSKHGEPVFFAAGSDGHVLRISHGGPATWNVEKIHRSLETPKALVAGSFGTDPKREAFALLGENGTLFLVERDDEGAWAAKRSETLGSIALAKMGSTLLAVGPHGVVRAID